MGTGGHRKPPQRIRTADHSLPSPGKPRGSLVESWMGQETLWAMPLWGGARPARSLQGGDSPSGSRQMTRLCPAGHPNFTQIQSKRAVSGPTAHESTAEPLPAVMDNSENFFLNYIFQVVSTDHVPFKTREKMKVRVEAE